MQQGFGKYKLTTPDELNFTQNTFDNNFSIFSIGSNHKPGMRNFYKTNFCKDYSAAKSYGQSFGKRNA